MKRTEIHKQTANPIPNFGSTKVHQVSWDWPVNTRPSDLKGFFVETAGSPSPDGPWERLTPQPVAWWEDRYTVQGVAINRCSEGETIGWSGHPECRSYRVIAVDEDGNESAPVYPSGTGTSNPGPEICGTGTTPVAPAHLRVSNSGTGANCSSHLDWDPSPDATEYYVYRMILSAHSTPYFYDTQRVPAPEHSYTELLDFSNYHNGAPRSCEDAFCVGGGTVVNGESQACTTGDLQAYYVTARKATGGESPKSNIVFWDCSKYPDPGYAMLLPDTTPGDAIAAASHRVPGDALACWAKDPMDARLAASPLAVAATGGAKKPLATAAMVGLGALDDPPWEKFDLYTDHLGSVRAVTDGTGAVVSRSSYFPFGEEIPPTQFSYNSHQFTGHERDHLPGMIPAIGLDYMLARYYEAGMGRFLSVDPERDINEFATISWNLYAYVRDNPLGFVDPSGAAVTSIKFVDSGPNGVSNPSASIESDLTKADMATLGPKSTPGGFFCAVNVVITVSADDSPSNYEMRSDHVFTSKVNGVLDVGGGTETPDPRNVEDKGKQKVMWDAPGPPTSPALPANSNVDSVSAFRTYAIDKRTGLQSGGDQWWGCTIHNRRDDKKATIKSGASTKEGFQKTKQAADERKTQ